MKKKTIKNPLGFIGRIGNFILRSRGDGIHNYVRLSNSDGSWIMEWRDDTFKYSWILMLAAEEKYHKILEMWIIETYHVTSCAPDPQFNEDILNALESLNARAVAMTASEPKNN